MSGFWWYVLGLCMGGVCVLCMWLVLIGESVGLREGIVWYNWLFGKLITPPWVCRKSIPYATGKRIFLMTTSCTQNMASSIAMDMTVLPSAIRGLLSVPETENGMGCSGGTKESEKYNCSSMRLMEEPVSIKIKMGLLSKLPDTRHCRSCKA